MKTKTGEMPFLELKTRGHYLRDRAHDLEHCEYFVPVRWNQTVSIANAVNELGLFGNQNTVCKPTTPKWRHTVEQLKKHFTHFDG